jgi:hypothetical protein
MVMVFEIGRFRTEQLVLNVDEQREIGEGQEESNSSWGILN